MAPTTQPKVTLKSLQARQEQTDQTLSNLEATMMSIDKRLQANAAIPAKPKAKDKDKDAPNTKTADDATITSIVDQAVTKIASVIDANKSTVAPPPVAEAPTTSAATKVEAKAKTTEMKIPTDKLVRGFGAIILGSAIIGALWYAFGGTGLLNILLFVALPMLALFAAFKLISYGSLQMIWNGSLEEQVNEYIKKMREDAAKQNSVPVFA